MKLPDFSELSPKKTGITQEITLDLRDQEDYFGLDFRGYIKVPFDGLYTFYVQSDDGSIIKINNRKIADNDGRHGIQTAWGQIGLEAGYHKFELQYFDNWYDHDLMVYYYHPKIGKQAITGEILYH